MPQCTAIKGNGHPCSKNATENGMCKLHNTIQNRRNEAHAADLVWFQIVDQIWTDGITTAAPLVQVVHQSTLREEWKTRLIAEIYEELEFVRTVRGVPTQTRSELHRLAEDTQNVHTGPVNKQTRQNEEILLSTPVPQNPKTMEEIVAILKKPKVSLDMLKWYTTKSCRTPDDYLYRRLLDALWVRIKASSDRDELVKRLIEEATESRKMCCEGHISRLCNVLVGFDDSFKPIVSTGELLQQKIAAIAEKDISVEYKVGEAWAVFEELGIPMDDRTAWVEAL